MKLACLSELRSYRPYSLINFGGIVGGVALGRLIDWIGPYCVLTAAYIFAGICIVIMAASASDIVMLLCFVFLAGAGILGAQLGMNALTAQVYPTTIRSTGVGWALGIGRIGSIIGPVLGGVLIAGNIETASILYLAALPPIMAAAGVLALGQIGPILVRSSAAPLT